VVKHQVAPISFVLELLQRSKREGGQTLASICERDELVASGKVHGLKVLDEL
jgi:hypothetical protein